MIWWRDQSRSNTEESQWAVNWTSQSQCWMGGELDLESLAVTAPSVNSTANDTAEVGMTAYPCGSLHSS
jgi:hypothetical protein